MGEGLHIGEQNGNNNRLLTTQRVPLPLILKCSHTRTQVALAHSSRLAVYSRRPDLAACMPGFSVQMGFGLHVGWAIEGPIGE